VSLECTNQELPTCPECHEQITDAESMFFLMRCKVLHIQCPSCQERLKITMKPLYDTEVVS